KALLELFKLMPLPEDIRKCLDVADLTGEQFERALFHQLLRNTKSILLAATDLNNENKQMVSLDFNDWDTLKPGNVSLGPDHRKTLCRGYGGYPRFGYMLGPMSIQVSLSNFAAHNHETYLNHMFGPGHSTQIDQRSKRFVVTKGGERVSGFHIVYVQGTPGTPTHKKLVKRFPDVAHISFGEINEKLFKNI
ncbi:hypothetical protein BGZ58_004938, partial [Dissophora ornata]